MGTRLLNRVVRQLRAATLRRAPGEADRDLLHRFVRERDESAFAALVQRHGPMVLGVCRRILGNVADAEDAFQVTFLVLVRNAAAVRKADSLGSWLYGVAYRTALEARRAVARRRAKEAKAMPRTESSQAVPADLLAVLDEELAALPEQCRAAVVLCDLEGKSYREAARELHCPEGTVASRLNKGRRLLAQRLRRREVALSAGALALALSQQAAPAGVPALLVGSTVQAAALVAAGQLAAVATPVALLLKGVQKTMLLAKLKLTAALFLMLALALGAGGLVFQPAGAQDAAGAKATTKPASELETLRHENELLRLNNKVLLEKLHALEAELRAHKTQANQTLGITFTPDGRRFALGVDGSVRIWDVNTGKEAGVEPGKRAPAGGVPDKEQLRRTADELEKLAKKLREQAK